MNQLSGFGAALKSLRKGRTEMTLAALADRAQVNESDLSRYERNLIWPSREVLERILDGLGITFIDLAVETHRQANKGIEGAPILPPSAPDPEAQLEERVRRIVRQEFGAGLQAIAGLPSANIQRLADFIRAGGVEPDLESVALLQSILDRKIGGGG